MAEIVLEDLTRHCEVALNCLGREVTSADYHEISRHLSQWKLIAPKLRFTDDEVDSIDADNPKAEMKKISFLKAWKQKFAMKATYRVLIESLMSIQRVEDARGVCQILKEAVLTPLHMQVESTPQEPIQTVLSEQPVSTQSPFEQRVSTSQSLASTLTPPVQIMLTLSPPVQVVSTPQQTPQQSHMPPSPLSHKQPVAIHKKLVKPPDKKPADETASSSDQATACAEVSSFKKNEDEIVDSLRSADLSSFLSDSIGIGVIPQAVKKRIKSLDSDSVPRPVMVRYLLLHAYESLGAKHKLYKHWMKVLDRYVSSEVLHKIRKSYGALASGSADNVKAAGGVGEGFKPDGAVGPAKLGEKRPHHSGCYLYEERALRSRIVGLGDVADQLDDQLIRHALTLNEEEASSLQKRPCPETPPVEIVSQSRDITVAMGKSTLLEVQVETREQTSITYQWLKDGYPLNEGKEFFGVAKPILLLNGILDGTYSCDMRVSSDPASIVHSDPVSVEVHCSVSQYKKSLADRYLAQHEIPEDSWPPQSSNVFINLALIKQGNIGEYARYTIQGNVDDIVADKERVEYEIVFTKFEAGARLLIEGRPGSGKTTLVHKFSQDWARGDCGMDLTNIKLLFLVHLRGFFNDPNICLRDLIQRYYMRESVTVDKITQFAEYYSGEGLCFILDGLDEYSPESANSTFLLRLIKKETLPKSVVIVASRPAAFAELRLSRRVATKQVEVIGFLKEQISQYIEEYTFSETEKRGDLHKYLDQHPNVHHMCYLPIHAAMVCYLFDKMGPRTETKMYTEFTRHTLLRTLTRSNDKSHYLKSLDSLQGPEKKVFQRICELSFSKTKASKQVLKSSEVSDLYGDISGGNESLGLITVDIMAGKFGFENLYTFLHLTFQEFLAAYHISKLEEEEQLKIIGECGKEKHMQVVWKFYCGLVTFGEQGNKFCSILSSEDDLFNVHCAFESQQHITCESVVRFGDSGTLSFHNHFLTPTDFTAIGYVIANTEGCTVEKVVLDKCKLGQEGVEAFLKEAGDEILSVRTLYFHGKDCVVEQFKLLNACLKGLGSLEVLDISNTLLGTEKVKRLTEGVMLSNLHKLKLSLGSSISCMKSTFHLLQFNSLKFEEVTVVDFMSDISIQDIFIDAFGKLPFYRGCCSKALVYLQDRQLEFDEVEIVAGIINKSLCCTSLDLTNCSIGDKGAEALAKGIAHAPMKQLVLCANNISDTGITALAAVLKNLSCLEVLDVGVNHISDRGAKTLAQNFQHCAKLLILRMLLNHVGDSGSIAIAECLKHLTNLVVLDLRYNQLGDEGAMAVTRAVKEAKTSSTLLIWNHRITPEGADAIACVRSDVNVDIHALNLTSLPFLPLSFDILALNMHCSDDFRNVKALSTLGISTSETYLNRVCRIIAQCINLQTLTVETTPGGGDIVMILDIVMIVAKGLKLKHFLSLQTLNLQSNGIDAEDVKALTDVLIHCHNLQTLNLQSNSVGAGAEALAGGMVHFSNLHNLNLEKNNIGAGGTKALAEGLKHCSNLQVLNLSSNAIGANGVEALAEGLKHCPVLQKLYLENNNIGACGAKALAKGLKYCPVLQMLCLGNNNICADGAESLAEGLTQCLNLQTLNLETNSIGVSGVTVLAESLKHCPDLQALHLNDNKLHDVGAIAIGNSLEHWPKLQTLYLGENGIENFEFFLGSLKKHCSSLHTLNLNHNGMYRNGVEAITEALKYLPSLRTLNLDRSHFMDDRCASLLLKHCLHLDLCDSKVIFKALDIKHHCDLHTLKVADCKIGTVGAKSLAASLEHFPHLQTLDLRYNLGIGSEGAKALAEGLKSCLKLQILNLGWTHAGTDGAKAIAESLNYWPNLQTLVLVGNSIGTDGTRFISEGIRYCPNLLTLNLAYNSIGADGAMALADNLKYSPNLTELDLGSNHIGKCSREVFAKCAKYRCPSLKTLKFYIVSPE